ncbi:MAG: TolC family protein [Solitalea-like symbiont of Tyrophagus putrescentiae]
MNQYHIFIFRICLFLMLFIGLESNLYAQNDKYNTEGETFDLQKCIEYAYKNKNEIINSGLDIKIAEAKTRETIGSYMPEASISSSLNNYPVIKSSIISVDGNETDMKMGTKYDSNFNLRVNQLIFQGETIIGIMSANIYKELYVKQHERTKIDTRIAVSKAYYNLLVSKEQIQMLNASIKRIEQTLRETKALKDQGMAEDIEVRRIEVLYNNTVTEKNNALKYQKLALEILKYQMGMPFSESLMVTDTIQANDLKEIKPSVNEDYTSKRIEYSLLETQLSIEKSLHKINLWSFLPTISAFANFGSSYMNDIFSQLYSKNYPGTQIGLSLSLTLFNGGKRINKIIQSKYNVQKAVNNLSAMKKTIDMEIEDSYTKYLAALDEIKNQSRNRDLAKEVVRVSNIKYIQGLGSSLEVTTAEESLRNAELNYIKSLYNAFIAKFDLEKAMGNDNKE